MVYYALDKKNTILWLRLMVEAMTLFIRGICCGYCIDGVPNMKEAYDKYKDRMEIVDIACHDKVDKVKATIDEHGMNWTSLMSDGAVHASYAVGSYHTKIIIDLTGVIAYRVAEERPEIMLFAITHFHQRGPQIPKTYVV